MQSVLGVIFHILYWVMGLAILARACLLVVAYLRAAREDQRRIVGDCLTSVILETGLLVVVNLCFALSRTGLIPLALLLALLFLIRSVAPFEKTAARCVYSLLSAWFPEKQGQLDKMVGYHVF